MTVDQDKRPTKLSLSSLGALSGLVLAVATIFGFSLHLVGHAYQVRYLTLMGVEPDLFPRSTDWQVIQGYYIALHSWFKFLVTLFSVSTLLYVALLVLLQLFADAPTLPRLFKRLPPLSTYPPWLRRLLKAVLIPLAGLTVVILLVTTAGFVLLLPPLMGEEKAREDAQQERTQLERLTGAPTEVFRAGVKVAEGKVLASSPDSLAIYDIKLRRVLTIERAGVELRTTLAKEAP